MTNRSTAFQINGGLGRVICSIPALEKYQEAVPDDDFIIVSEFAVEAFAGHPTLHRRAYSTKSHNLFMDKIKDRNYYIPEPYAVWEYYNQKANIIEAFDISINNVGLRPLPVPSIFLNAYETTVAVDTLESLKCKNKKDKVLIIQPFGRGTSFSTNSKVLDPFGKSITIHALEKILKELISKYICILMTEHEVSFEDKTVANSVHYLHNMPARNWFGIIAKADAFLGCDSLGQHVSNIFNVPSVIVLGSTYAENVSYPNNPLFTILDFNTKNKMYSPIRLCQDDISDRANETALRLLDDDIALIVKHTKEKLNA